MLLGAAATVGDDDDGGDDDDDDDGGGGGGGGGGVDNQEWRTLWLDEAFWHILFTVDLVLVMLACRPTYKHHLRYTRHLCS